MTETTPLYDIEAGLAMVVSAASLGGGQVLVNILAFAGQRVVSDARAADTTAPVVDDGDTS